MFPCTKCGACCRRVRTVDPNWPVKADGKSCIHLQDDNTCGIYETRPPICRIEDVGRALGLSEGKHFLLSMLACNKMQVEDGMGAEYRVRV